MPSSANLPRGPGRKKGSTYGENTIRYYPNCKWCGRVFGAKRPDAKTHSPRCRVALKRYVDEHGKEPLFPFGVALVQKGEVRK